MATGTAGTRAAMPPAAIDPGLNILPQPPAAPARVSLLSGRLTVIASNSELSQILTEVARVSGMSIRGLKGGPRVFGVYGPADPRTVLASLLMASGYNFMLVGGDAVPRELVLTPQPKPRATVIRAPKPTSPDEYEDEYGPQQSQDSYWR